MRQQCPLGSNEASHVQSYMSTVQPESPKRDPGPLSETHEMYLRARSNWASPV